MLFSKPYIIAEAAQGYEGDAALAQLLVRGAAQTGADGIKFQVVFAEDLAAPGYVHFDLFKQLEMPVADWRAIRDFARDKGLAFFIDVFGPHSLSLAHDLDVDGIKIHSTCFFDDDLIAALSAMPVKLMLSIGGIEVPELLETISKHALRARAHETVIMYGFQAEPTPLASNHLRRIPEIATQTGLEVGFMDHSEGLGAHTISLSAVAMGFGVRVYEKHISLDHAIALEDHVSALTPTAFAEYVAAISELATALGDDSLTLGADEIGYRGRALKRVLAASDIAQGEAFTKENTVLLRAPIEEGFFRPDDVLGRNAAKKIDSGSLILPEDLS